MRVFFAVSLAGVLAGALPAQLTNLMGTTAGFDNSYTDRLGQNSTDVDCLTHFDDRHYRFGMLDRNAPAGTNLKVIGLSFRIQDQNISTPETYNLVGYLEDPATPDFPDVGNLRATANPPLAGPGPGGVWFRTGQLNFPVTGTGGAAGSTILVGVGAPSVVRGGIFGPNLEDVWLGVGLNGGNWPTDGLGVIITFGVPTTPPGTPPSLDDLGPRGQDIITRPATNFGCAVLTSPGPPRVPTGAVATYPVSAGDRHFQILLDPLVQAAGGIAVTQTNQNNYPSSLAHANLPTNRCPLGGTTNMLSGLHPDTNNYNASTPARADDVGFLITEKNRPNAICAVIVGFVPPPFGIQPLSALFPNDPDTRGMLCVDPGGSSTMFIGTSNASGVFQQMFGITPAIRAQIPLLAPLDIIWQGFVTEPTLTEVIGTGCVTQHL